MSYLSRIEQCLLPPPEIVRWDGERLSVETYTTLQKIGYCSRNIVQLGALLFAAPIMLTYEWWTTRNVVPLPRRPQRVPDISPAEPAWPPEQRGFATSLFQTSGLGTKWAAASALEGTCDWDQWMNDPRRVAHPEGFDYNNFFTDVLSDPAVYIKMLKDQGVTAHRFSLEWSVIEPRRGTINFEAVRRYRNFIQQLIAAGIVPTVTLCHFVLPDWFHRSGGFHNMDNIDAYADFACEAIGLFPEVTEWWSFNELGVKAFQQAREVYPTDIPVGSSLGARVHAAGINTRNMLIAHCKLHKRVSEKYPGRKLGVTHQWLKFDTASGNWLERLVAYFFTKFGFTPVYQFFKNGHYSFEFPFFSNIQFEVPHELFENQGHFLQRLGVQAYPMAMLKMGLNHGETYPGLPSAIKNFFLFSFGSSCEPGGTVMRFGPRWRADAMEEILDEAFALTNQVYITEYGSDAMIQKWGSPGFSQDDNAQADYLRQLTEKIRDYCKKRFRKIKGIFCWSDLSRQMEWENGFECRLGVINPVVDSQRRMIGWNSTPASRYLSRQLFIPKKPERLFGYNPAIEQQASARVS